MVGIAAAIVAAIVAVLVFASPTAPDATPGTTPAPTSTSAGDDGVLLVLVGIAVILGLDKLAQAWILEQGWYAPIEQIERSLFG